MGRAQRPRPARHAPGGAAARGGVRPAELPVGRGGGGLGAAALRCAHRGGPPRAGRAVRQGRRGGHAGAALDHLGRAPAHRLAPGAPAAGPRRGHRPAVLLRHHRPAQGRDAQPREPVVVGAQPRGRAGAAPRRRRARRRAAVPRRRPELLRDGHRGSRRHGAGAPGVRAGAHAGRHDLGRHGDVRGTGDVLGRRAPAGFADADLSGVRAAIVGGAPVPGRPAGHLPGARAGAAAVLGHDRAVARGDAAAAAPGGRQAVLGGLAAALPRPAPGGPGHGRAR